MTQEIIHIWNGQRKLISTVSDGHDRLLRCLNGWGYIRIMSEANRLPFQIGNELRVSASEIVTISCIQDMVVEMELITKQKVEQ